MVVKAFEELMGGDSGVAVADITGYHICMYVCMCMFKISIFISIYLLLLRTSPGTIYVCMYSKYLHLHLSLSLSLLQLLTSLGTCILQVLLQEHGDTSP